MQSKDLIKMNLESSAGMVLKMAQDMKDAPLTFPTPNGGNHPMWVLGHLTYSEGAIICGVMLGEPNPHEAWKEIFANGTEPVGDASGYPPFDEVIAKFQQTHEATLKLLDPLSENDLDQPSKNAPPQFESFFGTCRKCFMRMSNHRLTHYGQLADARRAAGRERLGV